MREVSKKFRSAIKTEYTFFPSLGLVSKINAGSHKDMNYKTFKKSYKVFKPYFKEIDNRFYEINRFCVLKDIGFKYENLMFQLTDGINTHKGLIFCAGIFYYCYKKSSLEKTDLQKTVAKFCQDLKQLERPQSKSDDLRKKYQIKHTIDYAIEGYEIVFDAYSFFKTLNMPRKTKYFTLLIYLITTIDDSTLINKIGFEQWLNLKDQYKIVLNKLITNQFTKREIISLNKEAIKNNISPGGCADIFALVLFLNKINF